jgi:Na+-transporting NADH:ubiquinone oxidoreductase subunit C
MVIIVATLLSFVSMKLKPRQIKNEEIEKMKNILASVNIQSDAKNAEEIYNKYIIESYVVNISGEKLKDLEAFSVDLKKELAKINKINTLNKKLTVRTRSPFKNFIAGIISFRDKDKSAIEGEALKTENTRRLPVYICKKGDKTYYIFALRGKGLWGPIWGYLSLQMDFNTVYGTYFGHETETPGLGANISTYKFQSQFQGKKLFDNSEFVSIRVVKGGAEANDLHGVDAISGSTVTSKGVEKMLDDCLSGYIKFINKQMN